jgi:dihydroxyacetone kinase
MDRENSDRAAEQHAEAEHKLDKVEGSIRKALNDLKELSGDLKHRIVGEKERREFPIDDDAPGDTEEALRDPQQR